MYNFEQLINIRSKVGNVGYYLIALLIVVTLFIPFYWMIITSIKEFSDTLVFPPKFWISNPQWNNFVEAVNQVGLFHYFKNSIIVTFSILFAQVITVIPAAYAFSRYRFRGRDPLFYVILATSMLPAQLIFLPIFIMLANLDLINSYASLVLPHATSSFAIFMLRQRFMQIPEEIIEAARLDNASELMIIWKIMIPVAKSTIMTLGLLTFISSWNDYFWPTVMTTTDAVRTLQVGVAKLKAEDGLVHYNLLMAGNVILIAPLIALFLLLQKQIVQAFTYTGEK